MNEATFPAFDVASPWLLGQGGALLLVAAVSVGVVFALAAEARGRRLGALGWGLASTIVPGAWVAAAHLPRWVERFQPPTDEPLVLAAVFGLVLHGAVALVSIYLSDLVAATERRLPQRPAVAPAKPLPPRPAAKPAHPAKPAKPIVRPAPATVASAPKEVGNPAASGLLEALASGGDMQRASAARALALTFGGSRDVTVGTALIELLRDDTASDDTKVEAWVAMHQILGEPLDWEVESRLRRSGLGTPDPEQLVAWEARLSE